METFDDDALRRAKELDALPVSQRGRLHGLIVGVKDEVHVAGYITGFGTRANDKPAKESSHIVRALEATGAIMIGHTRMPEFGAWPVTESTYGGITRNPLDTRLSPGGSSGGTAAAVAGGLIPVGIGGDGGGSIRIPAAMTGLVGLKPRRGRVSTAPEPHLWWSLGVTGVLTKSVRDAALIYDVISGNEATDLYTADSMGSLVDALDNPPSLLKFMTVSHAPAVGIARTIRDGLAQTERKLAKCGYQKVPGPRFLPDATRAFVPQFFAGIRAEYAAVDQPELLESRTARVNSLGAWVSDDVRKKAEARGEAVAQKVERLLDQADVILTPTLAALPPRADVTRNKGAIRTALVARPYIAFTSLFNVTGHPAMTVPVQVDKAFPVGIQLVARNEETLVAVAQQIMGGKLR